MNEKLTIKHERNDERSFIEAGIKISVAYRAAQEELLEFKDDEEFIKIDLSHILDAKQLKQLWESRNFVELHKRNNLTIESLQNFKDQLTDDSELQLVDLLVTLMIQFNELIEDIGRQFELDLR